MPVMIMLMSASCGTHQPRPLLSGKINVTEPTELTFRYDINGDLYTDIVMTDSTGVFSYNPQLQVDATEISIYTGNHVYGAYIENGKNTIMEIEDDNVVFSGDNVDRSDYVNVYEQEFSYWKFKNKPGETFSNEEYNNKVETSYQSVISKLNAVNDEEARGRYQKIADARKKYFDIEGAMLNLGELNEEQQAAGMAKLDSLVASIDPNTDEARLSGLINYWFTYARLGGSPKPLSSLDFTIGMYEAIDSALTNDNNKKGFYSSLGAMFFRRDLTDSIADAFMEKAKPFIANAPQVQKEFEEYMIELSNNVNDGDALPNNPVLIAPDGSKTTLADELQGKVVYVDFWATWCGPCCNEIPFMEKVYEQFKDNDNIKLISISIDDDRDAWLAKLDADKPGWPQFVMDKTTGDAFSKAMKINSIPRFLIIGQDGNFISTKAVRPSNDKIVEILNQAIEK